MYGDRDPVGPTHTEAPTARGPDRPSLDVGPLDDSVRLFHPGGDTKVNGRGRMSSGSHPLLVVDEVFEDLRKLYEEVRPTEEGSVVGYGQL